MSEASDNSSRIFANRDATLVVDNEPIETTTSHPPNSELFFPFSIHIRRNEREPCLYAHVDHLNTKSSELVTEYMRILEKCFKIDPQCFPRHFQAKGQCTFRLDPGITVNTFIDHFSSPTSNPDIALAITECILNLRKFVWLLHDNDLCFSSLDSKHLIFEVSNEFDNLIPTRLFVQSFNMFLINEVATLKDVREHEPAPPTPIDFHISNQEEEDRTNSYDSNSDFTSNPQISSNAASQQLPTDSKNDYSDDSDESTSNDPTTFPSVNEFRIQILMDMIKIINRIDFKTLFRPPPQCLRGDPQFPLNPNNWEHYDREMEQFLMDFKSSRTNSQSPKVNTDRLTSITFATAARISQRGSQEQTYESYIHDLLEQETMN